MDSEIKKTIVLNPIKGTNLANEEKVYWSVLDTATDNIYNNTFISPRMEDKEQSADTLIYFANHIISSADAIRDATKNGAESLPIEKIEWDELTSMSNYKFIIPEIYQKYESTLRSKYPGLNIEYNINKYWENNNDKIQEFTEYTILTEYVDHKQLFEGVSNEGFYGRYVETYNKVYILNQENGEHLDWDSKAGELVTKLIESSNTMRDHDLAWVTVGIAAELPTFIRDHNQLVTFAIENNFILDNY